ncbi:hypothetical protein MoryE10_21730 [Methylogaea oryzae]|uniref:Uncharacterized protein n=1 Tax=Methylogaea oryzae TaxID=1295382 RepID=A0A8D4VQT9_9GAMM|nr:hypothetical protein MoryE10_21730 [Methylogaea oryzae]
MSSKCLKLDLLKTFLGNFEHTLDNKPNGQSMYTFTNGLVLNVYETGSVVFQGSETDGTLAKQIRAFIDSVNAPFLK